MRKRLSSHFTSNFCSFREFAEKALPDPQRRSIFQRDQYLNAVFIIAVVLTVSIGCNRSGSSLPQTSAPVSTPALTALTAEKAQDAVDRFVSANGSGRLRIRGGVREVPSDNSAVADLDLEDFQSNNRLYRSDKWTGQAIFSKFSDGKWTLTQIMLRNASDYAWQSWKPTIEVR